LETSFGDFVISSKYVTNEARAYQRGGGGGRGGNLPGAPKFAPGPQIWKIKKNNVERFLNNGLRKNFLNQNFADWSCFNQNLS
jgi:hypothetical protein